MMSRKTEAFLVYDESFGKSRCEFLDWLISEGFSFGDTHGNWGCPWLHVSITNMRIAYGMPGVEIIHATGNHAVTLEEFMVIYNIFKKYAGKKALEF